MSAAVIRPELYRYPTSSLTRHLARYIPKQGDATTIALARALSNVAIAPSNRARRGS